MKVSLLPLPKHEHPKIGLGWATTKKHSAEEILGRHAWLAPQLKCSRDQNSDIHRSLDNITHIASNQHLTNPRRELADPFRGDPWFPWRANKCKDRTNRPPCFSVEWVLPTNLIIYRNSTSFHRFACLGSKFLAAVAVAVGR